MIKNFQPYLILLNASSLLTSRRKFLPVCIEQTFSFKYRYNWAHSSIIFKYSLKIPYCSLLESWYFRYITTWELFAQSCSQLEKVFEFSFTFNVIIYFNFKSQLFGATRMILLLFIHVHALRYKFYNSFIIKKFTSSLSKLYMPAVSKQSELKLYFDPFWVYIKKFLSMSIEYLFWLSFMY